MAWELVWDKLETPVSVFCDREHQRKTSCTKSDRVGETGAILGALAKAESPHITTPPHLHETVLKTCKNGALVSEYQAQERGVRISFIPYLLSVHL